MDQNSKSTRPSEEKIREIAQELDCGMICYLHKVSHEIKSFPDELRGMEPEREFWGDVMDEVEKESFDEFAHEHAHDHGA